MRLNDPVGGSTSSQTAVAPMASVMPPAEIRLPWRAVAGELMRLRPITNATAPQSQIEADDGIDDVRVHGCPSAFSALGAAGLRRNIWSIRSVTT